jgi:hypothetical protein
VSLRGRVKRILIVGCFGSMIVVPFAGFGQAETEGSDTLVTSHLAAPIKERIYRELEEEFSGGGDLERSVLDAFPLKMIKLGPNGKQGIRIWGSGKDGVLVCGAMGNCPVWVFDPKTGDLLLSANGWELTSESTIHNGRYDFVTRHNMSADTGIRDWYQFDGHVYKQVRETEY